MTSNECIVCGSPRVVPFYAGLLKCADCSHIFADLGLTGTELFALYEKGYFFGDEYSNYVADKEVLQKNFRLRFRTLGRFLDGRRHRHLLEVGSAYGFFLDVVREHFETVRGIDITEDGVSYAREHLGLDVAHADLLTHDFGGRKFDVVCMWDTIEHLHNPDRYIEKIAQITEQGALLAVTTGDIGSLNARVKKERWRLIHPPTHAHYFSVGTLSKLLSRHGFDLLHSEHCGFYRSVDNIAYNIFVLRKKMPGLYHLLERTGLMHLHFYLNLYDIMYVIVKKR